MTFDEMNDDLLPDWDDCFDSVDVIAPHEIRLKIGDVVTLEDEKGEKRVTSVDKWGETFECVNINQRYGVDTFIATIESIVVYNKKTVISDEY